MKKRKLRGYVVTGLYLMVLGVMAIGITFLSQSIIKKTYKPSPETNYSMSVFHDEQDIPVQSTVDEKVSKPYTSEKVSMMKGFYSKDDSKEKEEQSLIYYDGTYMPSTGIIYTSDEAFDITSILSGTVKDIKKDDTLGSVITIEHTSKLTAVYYTTGEVKVKVNDTVTQNQIIASSGETKLSTDKKQALLFETYMDGSLVNPESIFAKNSSELN